MSLPDELSTTPKWLLERRETWKQLRELAEQFAEKVHDVLGSVTVWLYGSVARGDFNFWSDIDVLIVAENLPEHPLKRLDLLMQLAPPKVEPIGYTKTEFDVLLAKRHPNLMAILSEAICLRDDLGLAERVAIELKR